MCISVHMHALVQIESNFRRELESANIVVESPTFKSTEGATKSAIKFFVSDLLLKLEDQNLYYMHASRMKSKIFIFSL